MFSRRYLLWILLVVCGLPAQVLASEWFVASGATGNGSSSTPFGSIMSAIAVAQPGDIITVRPGTYAERLTTVRHGLAAAPITLRSQSGRGSVLVSLANEVLQVDHAYFVVDGFVFDAQYALEDVLDINSAATGFVLRNSEVRRTTKDCVDISSPAGVVIDRSIIHHCLNATGGRTDAHGVVAGAVRDLLIRDTEIHSFSGDALQLDPNRTAPGWDRVTLERCRLWLRPLTEDVNGFRAGTVPGENGIDTKALATAPRARITVRDTIAYGFRAGLISNMAAFNFKENVDAIVDGVTVYDSDIAFRTRGPGTSGGAWVRVQNAVVYNVARAVRYEDNIERLLVYNSTFGANVLRSFEAASSSSRGPEVRNVLMLAASKPAEAADASNLAVAGTQFVDVATHDYRLATGAVAIDTGISIDGVTTDRAGTSRPQGAGFDVGAFEAVSTSEMNEAPLVDGSLAPVAGNPAAIVVNATFSDANAGDTHTATVDWGDGTRAAVAVTESAGHGTIAATHVYASTGTYAITVTVADSAGASGSDSITAVILPGLSLASGTITEGSSGSALLTVNVTLSSASATPVSVSYATVAGTATAGVDFTAASGVITFSPGVTVMPVSIGVTGDTVDELNEMFEVVLTSPAGAAIASGAATMTILDDDITALRIDDVALSEPATAADAVFPVRLLTPSARTVRATWHTRYLSATPGLDFVTSSGVVTFAPGQLVSYVRVPVLGDILDENSETFEVVLSSPEEATIVDSSGRAMIADDDPAPSLSITGAATVVEGTTSKKVILQVSLSTASGQTVRVSFASVDRTATAALDYLAASGSLKFGPGITSQSITLTVLPDAVIEPAESFAVLLSSPQAATIAVGESLVTITDPAGP